MSRVPVGLDYESHLLKPGMKAPKGVCLAEKEPGKEPRLYAGPETSDVMERHLKRGRITAHNAPFDLGVAAADKPELLPLVFKALDEGRVHCTKIRQKMIANADGELKYVWNEEKEAFEGQSFDLARTIYRLTGEWIAKGEDTWRMHYWKLDGRPVSEYPKEAYDYAVKDSRYHQTAWEKQEEIVAPEGIPFEDHETQVAWALYLTGEWGVRTDPVMVAEYKKELKAQFEQQVAAAQEFGFYRKNQTRDMKKIVAAIEKWHKDHDKSMIMTPKGGISTKREQLRNTDHPGLHAVADAVKIQKNLTTYVPVLELGFVQPVTPDYNSIIETYRTSCARPNAQNMPRKGKVRGCFVPRDGCVFVFCDYDTLEMFTWGQVCKDLLGYSSVLQAGDEGLDFHTAFAANMLGVSYRDLAARVKSGDPEAKDARQFCKIANYGMAGGMGWHTFIDYAKNMGGTIVSPTLAQKLHAGFRKQWDEAIPYFNMASFACDGGKCEEQVFPRSGLIRGDVGYTQWCNGNFQHIAAMGAKAALYAAVKEMYVDAGSPLYGCRPWLFAHDEIGMEVPYEAFGPRRSHEAAARLREIMIEKMKVWTPDAAINATAAMSRRWYKGADPVFKDGLLVPCKPQQDGRKTIWVADL